MELKHIKKFDEYLMEAKSISDISVEYANMIWSDISTYIETVKNDTDSANRIYENQFSQKYDFADMNFTLKGMVISVFFRKYKSNVCNGVADLSSSQFDKGILYFPKIKLEIYFDEFDDDFEAYIKSVLLHEIIHVYQVYKMGNKKIDSNWNLGNVIISTRSRIKNNNVKELSTILYYASEHEIMAQLHQYFLFKTEYHKEYSKIFDIQKMLSNFDTSKFIIDDDLIKDLNIFREEYNSRIFTHKPNNKYYRNACFIWKKEINIDNVDKFLKYVETFVGKSLSFLNKKIKHVDLKCEDISEAYDVFGYNRYIDFLSEY